MSELPVTKSMGFTVCLLGKCTFFFFFWPLFIISAILFVSGRTFLYYCKYIKQSPTSQKLVISFSNLCIFCSIFDFLPTLIKLAKNLGFPYQPHSLSKGEKKACLILYSIRRVQRKPSDIKNAIQSSRIKVRKWLGASLCSLLLASFQAKVFSNLMIIGQHSLLCTPCDAILFHATA